MPHLSPGTPGTSPERQGRDDTSTDVYSLGVVLANCCRAAAHSAGSYVRGSGRQRSDRDAAACALRAKALDVFGDCCARRATRKAGRALQGSDAIGAKACRLNRPNGTNAD